MSLESVYAEFQPPSTATRNYSGSGRLGLGLVGFGQSKSDNRAISARLGWDLTEPGNLLDMSIFHCAQRLQKQHKGCWENKTHRLIFGFLGSNLTYINATLNLDHKRNVRDMDLNWQIAKYHKDPMTDCIMRYKLKSRWVNVAKTNVAGQMSQW